MKRLVLLLGVVLASPAYGQECPVGMVSCKVIYLSPAEETVLMHPGGILATAAQARKLDFAGAAQYFAAKIRAAPQGEVKRVVKNQDRYPGFQGEVGKVLVARQAP